MSHFKKPLIWEKSPHSIISWPRLSHSLLLRLIFIHFHVTDSYSTFMLWYIIIYLGRLYYLLILCHWSFCFLHNTNVSDNQLVISNFLPSYQQQQGPFLLHGCQAGSSPACCRINLSCPPHYGDQRGVRDSSRWNAWGKEDRLPVSVPIFSTTASSLRSALESAVDG